MPKPVATVILLSLVGAAAAMATVWYPTRWSAVFSAAPERDGFRVVVAHQDQIAGGGRRAPLHYFSAHVRPDGTVDPASVVSLGLDLRPNDGLLRVESDRVAMVAWSKWLEGVRVSPLTETGTLADRDGRTIISGDVGSVRIHCGASQCAATWSARMSGGPPPQAVFFDFGGNVTAGPFALPAGDTAGMAVDRDSLVIASRDVRGWVVTRISMDGSILSTTGIPWTSALIDPPVLVPTGDTVTLAWVTPPAYRLSPGIDAVTIARDGSASSVRRLFQGIDPPNFDGFDLAWTGTDLVLSVVHGRLQYDAPQSIHLLRFDASLALKHELPVLEVVGADSAAGLFIVPNDGQAAVIWHRVMPQAEAASAPRLSVVRDSTVTPPNWLTISVDTTRRRSAR